MSSVVKVNKSQRLPFLSTLRFKFAVALTFLVTTLLIASAALVTYTRINELDRDIAQHADTFSQLTYAPIGEMYQRFSSGEAYKFRDEVLSLIRKGADVQQIMLIDPQGNVLFDSADQTMAFKSPQGTGMQVTGETLAALRKFEVTKQRVKNKEDVTVLELINPYFDNTGRVPFFVRYVISFESLRREIRSSIIATSLITFAAIGISILIAMISASRITKPISLLAQSAAEVAQGNYNMRVEIHTHDELQDLAHNFSYMAEQLKINISKLEDSKAKLQDSNLRLEQSNVRLANTNKQLETSKEQLQDANLRLEKSNKQLEVTNRELQGSKRQLQDANTQLEFSNTQLAETNIQLERANEELKELDRLKSEFLQTISHELRTPLSAIKGYNEYLLEQMVGPLSSGQERALRIIQRNIERLTTYINALLDFSRMESGTIPISIQSFNILTIIEQTILTYKSQIDKNLLVVVTDIEDNLPFVAADRDRISQVIDNLLSNAIKFTPEEGDITIKARTVFNKNHKQVEISISDTGVGISQKSLDKIFDRFYQADSSTTRKYGGIGLGLSLVKTILDSHKTTISVESEEQVGTTFSFLLDAADMEKIEPLETDTLLALVENKKSYLIELIDDEPDINDLLKISLIKEGYNVIDAATGEEGLQLARVHRPDLIILDVRLPDINGFEVLRRLKQEFYTRTIPVMIMSILNDPNESMGNGAVDHLTKPVDFKHLKSKINLYLHQSPAMHDNRPTVMVVDDEQDVRQILCERLALEGFNTLVAADGYSVFDLLKKERSRPSLILLDVMMPGQSGWEVMAALKADPATAQIPIILVSAKSAEEDIRRGYELGAHDYIVKPFEIKDLLLEVKNVVREQQIF